MPDSIRALLSTSRVLQHVVLPPAIDALLSGLEVATGPTATDDQTISLGTAQLVSDLSKSPIPGFDFALAPPTGVVKPAPFKLQYDDPAAPTSFRFWLVLADQEQALFVFAVIEGLPGLGLTGASRVVAADGTVTLTPLPAGDPGLRPHLVSRTAEPGAALGPALLIEGSSAAPAAMRFTPDTSAVKGVVALGLEPRTVVFGDSQIGFDCPSVVIDDSEDAAGPGAGAPDLQPPLSSIPADTPAWRGILARQLDFYLPGLPLFGGQPIKGYFAIPTGDGAVEMVGETKVAAVPGAPGQSAKPGYSIRLECRDPTARGFAALVPTLISTTMELPLDRSTGDFAGSGGEQTVTFGAGKPVTATATLARDPANGPGTFKLTLAIASQGTDGLVSVTTTDGGAAKIFNVAAALATAVIAAKDVAHDTTVGGTPGVVLDVLLAAGEALSSLFTDDSAFVLHGVEIESSGHGAPIGGPITLTLDYSVAVRVTGVDVGVLSVSMAHDQPMRIRIRQARMSFDPHQSGLKMIGLDFGRSTMELENPGAWKVGGLDSLFDVLRSRSGRGSSWFEVDLRFKLNLGPINVSGATIRVTLGDGGGTPTAAIRGLQAGLDIPHAIEASGGLQLLEHGFAADLRAKIVPLNVAADADVVYDPPMVLLGLDVDLPAPIPLANSGFGLFGLGGLLGFSAAPDYSGQSDPDPVLQQLKWTPKDAHSFRVAHESTFGLFAAVGTLPDLGFTFSAKAGVLITVPDIAIRGSLNGRILQPAAKLSDLSYPPTKGISFLGFIAVDAIALSFAVLGEIDLRPLLDIRVPLAGHFPFTGDRSDWYVYLGADGADEQDRQIGPISARVLPDFLHVGGDAYVMVRGKGLADWPHGRALPSGPLTIADGFVLAFGFAIQNSFGVKPIAWAELYASLDMLLGAKPPTLAGFGRAGGSLNLGPFSLGVQASVAFMVREDTSYLWAEVSGRIKLLFITVKGKVTISCGQKPNLTLPAPEMHPLDRLNDDGTRAGSLGVLTDDSYRVLSRLVEDPAQITPEMCVWPDAMVSLSFAITPAISSGGVGQFPGVLGPGALPAPARIGSEMLHYNWRLESVELYDVTTVPHKFTDGGLVSGELSARWQVPRSGGGGIDISELLLFSTGPDVWVNRLADGGDSIPGNPLQQAANVCTAVAFPATEGWAVGLLAAQDVDGFRLPPDPVSADPRVSRVEVQMHHSGVAFADIDNPDRAGVPLDQAAVLPQPYSLDPASLVTWPDAVDLGRRFHGHLAAPNLRWLTGRSLQALTQGAPFAAQVIELDLTDPIIDGELVLVGDIKLFDTSDPLTGMRVMDSTRATWTPSPITLPGGLSGARYRAPHSDPVSSLRIRHSLASAIGVVGVGGITVTARNAAATETTLIVAERARQATAAAAGPKSDPTTNVAHQRTILGVDRLYRLDIDMVWAGELSNQNAAGQVVSVAKVPYGTFPQTTTYSPKGSPPITTKRQLFFRTAPRAAFEPEMLERYLAGYDPGQSDEFRFCDDPLRAHFLQDHVAALAKAYGFDLQVAVRRVDRPGAAYANPLILIPIWSFGLDPAFLGDTDAKRFGYAQASDCAVPTPGATATVNHDLEPEAWYDLHVVAKSTTTLPDGALPGVTFRTSRWGGPRQMFAALGLTTYAEPTATVLNGDLAITTSALAPAVALDDDQAFQNALLSLGLDGWPLADAPRLSRLWVQASDATWRFAGLMIESPEPIHRVGRLAITGLTLEGGPAITFDVVRRDRTGSRLIYLTSRPFAVPTPAPQLVVEARSTLLALPTYTFTGTLAVPPAPTFAMDP